MDTNTDHITPAQLTGADKNAGGDEKLLIKFALTRLVLIEIV